MKNISVIVGYIFVAGVFALLIKVFAFGLNEGIPFEQQTFVTKTIVIWGFVGGMSLWFWMLADFFQNGVPRLKKTWGFLLILGNYFVACIYFLVVYAPRKIKASST